MSEEFSVNLEDILSAEEESMDFFSIVQQELSKSKEFQSLIDKAGTEIEFTTVLRTAIEKSIDNLPGVPILGTFTLPVLRQDYDPHDGKDPFYDTDFLAIAYSNEHIILLSLDVAILEKIFQYCVSTTRNSSDFFIKHTTLNPGRDRCTSVVPIDSMDPSKVAGFNPLTPEDTFIHMIMSRDDLEANSKLAKRNPRFAGYEQVLYRFHHLQVSNPETLDLVSKLQESYRKQRPNVF